MTAKEVTGWGMSLLLHGGVVAFALFGLPGLGRERPTPPPPIAIEFVEIAEKTQIVAPEPVQETDPAPVVERKPLTARSEPPPAENADAVPSLEAATKVARQVTPKAKPKVTAREQRLKNLTVRAKPKPPSRFDSKSIAAVIDRSVKEEAQPVRQTPEKAEKTDAEADPFASLRGAVATASLIDALSEKLSRCWNFPTGAKGIEAFEVVIRIHLAPDGSLSRLPELRQAGDLRDGFYRSFTESAQRAVRQCAPYTEALPFLRSGQAYIDFSFRGEDFAGG